MGVDVFLDVYKKTAFKNVIEEPALSYFDRFGEHKDMKFSRFRSLLKYLYLINKKNWFGLQMPISLINKKLTHEDCVDILAGLPHDTWELFKYETNALPSISEGRIFETIQEEDRSFCELIDIMRHPRFLLYANRFAFFFRKEVLVKQMFKVMSTNESFRQYSNDLYPLYKEEHGFHEKSLHEFLYSSGLEDLNIDKAAHFFWFCGVIRERDAQITWNTHGPEEFEMNLVQDSKKDLKKYNGINNNSTGHNQELASFNLNQEVSVFRKKIHQMTIQTSKYAKAG